MQDSPRLQARNFALRAVAWSLGLFGVIRLSWFEAHLVLPLTQLQARLAQAAFGPPAAPIEVTLACSGADVLALSTAAILAYPAAWTRRLAGAAGGVALILALNTLRIGTLGMAAASPFWFEAIHVFVWPAFLTLAIAGYVFAWMRAEPSGRAGVRTPSLRPALLSRVEGRFVVLTVLFLVVFVAAAPLYLESAAVLSVASLVARASALALRVLGIQAVATANVLTTARGGFLVTQECIVTPLIPVYLAAAFVYSSSGRRLLFALLGAVPLFAGLGVARLLVIALPAALVASPVFLIHAFYQLLFAAILVCLAAYWRQGSGAAAWGRAILGAALGGACVYVAGPLYRSALTFAFAAGPPLGDPQGAITFLPAFQVGLYVALSVAAFAVIKWRPFVTGLALIGVSQVAFLAALHFLARHDGFMPHVRDVRAWALAAPLAVVVALVTYDRPRR